MRNSCEGVHVWECRTQRGKIEESCKEEGGGGLYTSEQFPGSQCDLGLRKTSIRFYLCRYDVMIPTLNTLPKHA